MEETSQRQLEAEATTWLHVGRRRLLEELVRAYLSKQSGEIEVLELGAGAGQNLSVLAQFGRVDANEVSDYFAEILSIHPHLRRLYRDPIPVQQIDGQYDLIVAMDVLEHIEDDRSAMQWICNHLRPGGIFVACVPAYQWLFGDHDRAVHHFRRYTRTSLTSIVAGVLRVRQAGYFNTSLFPMAVVGRGAWQIMRRISRSPSGVKQSSTMPQMINRIFASILVSEAVRIGQGASPNFGLSVFCVGERPTIANGINPV
jgi:SAM-dependent methyltransferase